MKKIIYKLTYLTALFAFIYSCDDVDRVYYNDAAETVLSLSDDNLVLNEDNAANEILTLTWTCLLYTSPSPRDRQKSRMPSSA